MPRLLTVADEISLIRGKYLRLHRLRAARRNAPLRRLANEVAPALRLGRAVGRWP